MNCPHCINQALMMSDRQGVEIDYCPKCRGVWLDRGELDKLIERSLTVAAPAQPAAVASAPAAAPAPAWAPPPHYGYRKPKSWLSDIFD
jgi:Zn-finger nucleic acid-binding protein